MTTKTKSNGFVAIGAHADDTVGGGDDHLTFGAVTEAQIAPCLTRGLITHL